MDTQAGQPKGTPSAEPRFIASIGPHIRSGETVGHIMWTVSASLFPAAALSVYYFGLPAAMVLAVAIASAVVTEAVAQKVMGVKVTVHDGSAFLTGLLLGMNLPAGVPFYLPLLGSAAAIIIVKQLFGGLGYNISNPALIGRALLLASFPRLMTTWPAPSSTLSLARIDAVTAATPLGILKEEGYQKLLAHFADKYDMYTQMLLGHRGGSMGEVSIVVLLAGAAYLMLKGYISWHIPVSFIATVAGITWLSGGDPVLAVLSGGLVLGAFFMATDYVTAPQIRRAQVCFGIGCGGITALIRLLGGYPEGVCYAIIIMNLFTPLLDRAFKPKKFGAAKA